MAAGEGFGDQHHRGICLARLQRAVFAWVAQVLFIHRHVPTMLTSQNACGFYLNMGPMPCPAVKYGNALSGLGFLHTLLPALSIVILGFFHIFDLFSITFCFLIPLYSLSSVFFGLSVISRCSLHWLTCTLQVVTYSQSKTHHETKKHKQDELATTGDCAREKARLWQHSH
jgi:hypothetical protein